MITKEEYNQLIERNHDICKRLQDSSITPEEAEALELERDDILEEIILYRNIRRSTSPKKVRPSERAIYTKRKLDNLSFIKWSETTDESPADGITIDDFKTAIYHLSPDCRKYVIDLMLYKRFSIVAQKRNVHKSTVHREIESAKRVVGKILIMRKVTHMAENENIVLDMSIPEHVQALLESTCMYGRVMCFLFFIYDITANEIGSHFALNKSVVSRGIKRSTIRLLYMIRNNSLTLTNVSFLEKRIVSIFDSITEHDYMRMQQHYLVGSSHFFNPIRNYILKAIKPDIRQLRQKVYCDSTVEFRDWMLHKLTVFVTKYGESGRVYFRNALAISLDKLVPNKSY